MDIDFYIDKPFLLLASEVKQVNWDVYNMVGILISSVIRIFHSRERVAI